MTVEHCCGQRDSCVNVIDAFADGTEVRRLAYGSEWDVFGQDTPPERCPVCDVLVGGVHHDGCMVERCARCHGQRIACACAQ